jgi:dGTPase
LLQERLYMHPVIVEERDRSIEALRQLFQYYLDHPEAMPHYFAAQAEREPRHRVVCDYIAGMTDHFLLQQHRETLGKPKSPKLAGA